MGRDLEEGRSDPYGFLGKEYSRGKGTVSARKIAQVADDGVGDNGFLGSTRALKFPFGL